MRDCRTRWAMSSMSLSAAAASVLSIMTCAPRSRPLLPARCDVFGNHGAGGSIADDSHMVDAVEQPDVDGWKVGNGCAVVRRDHQLVVGAGVDRHRPLCRGKI